MKTRLLGGIIAVLAIVTGVLAGPRDAQWKQVELANNKGLPKTAIEQLELIIAGAQADKSYAEAIKAIARKIALEGNIQGNKAEEKIIRLQAELEKAPAAMKPTMEAILALWYWQYFQQNRWHFMQRTQTASAPGPDIQTWDLARILAEIDKHFTAALADEATLKEAPIGTYNDLLDQGTVSGSYRPTMFDVIAHEALRFYQTGEQGLTVAEDEFEVEADSPILADVTEFVNWQPVTSDSTSPKFKAIRLYQNLLKSHLNKGSYRRDAFLDTNLARLNYGKNIATGDSTIERYKDALLRFINASAEHESASRAFALLATLFNAEGNPAKARELAKRGYENSPGSNGGAQCYNLIQEIEGKSAQLNTESVWNAPWPTLDITYRNVTKVYFRAIPVDFVNRLKKDLENDELLKTKPVLEWEADLPPTNDYKQRTEKLPAPSSLKPGYYLIAASHDRSFSENNNQISATAIWVSDLALVIQTRNDGLPNGGLVLRANSGEPVAGATVRFWADHKEDGQKTLAPTETDENGCFEFPAKERSVLVLAEHDGQAVSTPRAVYSYGRERPERTETQTVFFTDRAIYRPGQTINYKGVSIRFNKSAGKYSILSDQKLTVVFNDPNGKEIARAEQRTNDYGSFSGVFTAPRDRLMGRMTIQVLGRPSQTSFNVEEYKRPKFQVELNAPAEAAKLDTPVILTGKATAYNGATIGGAKVKWRVERSVMLPRWCWWWRPPATKAISHGTAITEPDGTFKIQFPATPDRSVPTKNEPTFGFTIHTDVTDTTGETRSTARALCAGYTALIATLDTDDWQTPDKPVKFTIATRSLDGAPQPAQGKLTIHALQQPTVIGRAPLQQERYWWDGSSDEPKTDPTNPSSWVTGEMVAENKFETDATGKAQLTIPLKTGMYRASLETQDRFGKKVTERCTVEVVDPHQQRYRTKIPVFFNSPTWSIEPGETFNALWGTGYDKGRAFVELERNGKALKNYWTTADHTQELITQPVTEEMRGGFTVRVTYVRENRAYIHEHVVNVPWSNKQLTVKWEIFRSKLLPGQKETWTAVITGPNSKHTAAEMVATLYDASLDQYLPNNWPQTFDVFRQEFTRGQNTFQNTQLSFDNINRWDRPDSRRIDEWRYRAFIPEIISDGRSIYVYGSDSSGSIGGNDGMIVLSAFSVSRPGKGRAKMEAAPSASAGMQSRGEIDMASLEAPALTDVSSTPSPEPVSAPPLDLSKITARKNLNETAFFFPQLVASDDGVVRMMFTMPEALTEWKFLGFAHDKQLRSGFLTDKVVTTKDLMVEPNPPRFLREGDAIEFTVKVSNQSDQPQTGMVKLTFADAASQKSVDDALSNHITDQPFDVPAKQSRSYSWRVAVPDGLGFLTYKAVAATAQFSDGEEGFLPVLSRRILVTESLPLPIRGKETKQFKFTKLLESGASDTLRHQSLTVQMTSRPAWYAVMALPYLMEYPYECSEQVFNRLYANALARHIANSNPKIRQVFDLWKNTPALDSPLEKNQDLKSVLLEETPWLRQAKAESEARRNVGLLFDGNRLDEVTSQALNKLAERQLNDGLWSWFPGGRPSEYISLYIATGFGRLRHLGVEIDAAPAIKALGGLDASMSEDYRHILKNGHQDDYVPGYTDALYLYGRSFFLKDRPLATQHQEAIDFFLRQSRKFWLKLDSRQSQAQLALALQRFGDKETAQAIMKSIKERSVSDEELGMFWRDSGSSWWWYHAPIETQALMIEAFAEITDDTKAVEDCKVWLLKQKQTQDWKTTKATADAIYGLLVRGDNLLSSDALVEVSLAGQTIKPEKVEAGTGFYEQKFVREEIKPSMGQITVKKVDAGVSWGSVHWQYLEDMAKITPHEGTPLKLKKTLWLKETNNKGQVLKPVTGPVAIGDELVVRIELRTDRDMEFVHLKDQRGSGTEPVNVLSRYKYQDGLGYYESTRDTASHFFIDYLPKGINVFEYSRATTRLASPKSSACMRRNSTATRKVFP